MKLLLNSLRLAARALFAAFTLGLLLTSIAYLYLAPGLPTIESIKDMRLQVPLRVYAKDGDLIAEFGEKRRIPLAIKDVPERMIQAVLAAEDDRFFEHPGVDYQGLLRAVVHLVKTGDKGQGGSTITMQVARNFFLSSEKTYLRKLNEIFLALKIERELTKEDILGLYLNKIYLGNRAYGVAAAARIYYGKPINELSTAELAMIAGLPKAPSRYNPIVNSRRAMIRRGYVLGRMHYLEFIGDEEYKLAIEEPDSSSLHRLTTQVDAPYVAEMVRSYMVERYSNEAYTAGYKVYTTIDTRLQSAANKALRKALMNYDMRHGYRGRVGHINLDEVIEQENWEKTLRDYPVVGHLFPALVLEVKDNSAIVHIAETGSIEIPWEGLSWAKRFIKTNIQGSKPEQASSVLERGDIIRVQLFKESQWRLAQIPDVSGALVSISSDTGAIQALLGGFDFYHSKFNRAIQAERQPGSNFKPFIYSAALEKGFTAASLINDAPVVFDDPGLESAWRPENYSGKFFGPTRLRLALTKSRNLVSIRLLRTIGISYAINHARKFGFDTEKLPRDLSLALGSGAVTPISIARGYAVFANGGYLVDPHFITHIEDMEGNVIFINNLPQVCPECEEKKDNEESEQDIMTVAETIEIKIEEDNKENAEEIITPEIISAPQVVNSQNVYIMTSIMRDVVRYGTGRKALKLGRKDLAGKTGTTNDQRDAWFSGFNRDVVTTVWVGFDKPQPLGTYETGAKAALPMWVDYMREALKGIPEKPLERPEGLVSVRIDPETGLLAGAGSTKAIFETFRTEYVPKKKTTPGYKPLNGSQDTLDEPPPEKEQLF